MKVASTSDIVPGTDDELLLQRTTVTTERTWSMDWEDLEDADPGTLPNSLEKGSSLSHSTLDISASVHTGIFSTANMDYPDQTYLLHHCESNVIILVFSCTKSFAISPAR